MLSKDEIANGRTFILRLWDAEGKPTHWIESLRGDVARRWYELCQLAGAAARGGGPVSSEGQRVGGGGDAAHARRALRLHPHAIRSAERSGRVSRQ